LIHGLLIVFVSITFSLMELVHHWTCTSRWNSRLLYLVYAD